MRLKWILTGANAVVLAGTLVTAAWSSGAWTTMLRPRNYTDLLAEGDTVWCASLEGGLMRFTPSTGAFEFIAREPGGLASNRLIALALDRSRRLWVGTQGGGVSRLSADRKTWGVLNEFDGLPSDSVNALEADGDTLWIGTARGLALWNGREIAGTLPSGTAPSPFLSNDISGIAIFAGDLWVATRNGVFRSALAGGLSVWRADTLGLPTRRSGRLTNPVDALACDGSTLFARDSLRLFRWNGNSVRWERLDRLGDVRGVWDDPGGMVLTSSLGVYRWDGSAWVQIDNQIVVRGVRDGTAAATLPADGRAVAAHGARFCRQPAGPGPWTCTLPPGPPGNDVKDMILDGSRLYVSTPDEGFGRLDGQSWKLWVPAGPRNQSDTTFMQPAFGFGWLVDRRGLKWIGCWNTAFERFDDSGATPHFERVWAPGFHAAQPDSTCPEFCSDPHTFASCSALDSAGGHWFGMTPEEGFEELGIEYYDPDGDYVGNFVAELRSNFVRALTVSRNGRIWIGYPGGGLDYMVGPPDSGQAPQVAHVFGTDNFFVTGLAAYQDQVWVSTTSEVLRYSATGTPTRERSYLVPAQPSDQAHHPIEVGPDGSAWLGTVNGVRVYRPDGSEQNFNTSNSPLAHEEVRAIRIERSTGVVWIGTKGGVSRYDPSYVAPPPPPLARLEVKVYPNPARLTALGVRLQLSGNSGAYRGSIMDLSGRRVRAFSAEQNGTVIWDGRDSKGALVKPGIYFVHVQAGGRGAVVRIALVH